MINLFSLDNIQKVFSIIGSLSLGVAVITYFYNKNQDETTAALDQVNFFREKIILENDKLIRAIKTKNDKYIFSQIDLNKCNTVADIRKEFSVNYGRQLSIFYEASKVESEAFIDIDILDKHIFLLNMLEEFSLKVIHFKIVQSPVLCPVHAAFINAIEQNAVALFYMRDINSYDHRYYSNILSLYKLWKNKVGKLNVVKNLEKYGFITKEQAENIYNKKRQNINKIV